MQLTIHSELQKAVVEQLRDRQGAAVVLNPQTGEVLAMYSNPSYSLKEAQDEATYIQLEANDRDKPLVNRALGAYYIPGSTFKTVTMIAAFNAGMQTREFLCSGAVTSPRPARSRFLTRAARAKSTVASASTRLTKFPVISISRRWPSSSAPNGWARPRSARHHALQLTRPMRCVAANSRRFGTQLAFALARALAPREATIVAYARRCERSTSASIGYGQGYSGQMTPFEMALTAAAIANLEGKLMKPKIEFDQPPAVFAQAMSPQQAAEMRRIMGLVTGGSSGTARGVLARVHAAGIIDGRQDRHGGERGSRLRPEDRRTEDRSQKVERDRRGNVDPRVRTDRALAGDADRQLVPLHRSAR